MTTRDGTPARLPWDAADPFAYYERRRRRDGDVVWDDALGAWLVLGYHSAREILGGSGWTSSPRANPNAPKAFRAVDRDILGRNMLFADGEDHVRLRSSVRDVFTRSFIAGLETGVEAVASDSIDRIPAGVEFDFMAEIALPLPIAIAAAWLGLDVDSAQLLREESPEISRMLNDFNDADAIEAGTASFAALITDLLPLAADRRMHPADDLLSFMAADPQLQLDDVVITAVIIAVAGHETTANLLGSAMIRLLTPGADDVRPLDVIDTVDDQLIAEVLRLDGPVQAVSRTATCDQVVDGVAISSGKPALVVLAAANRDPAVFHEPDQMRPDRAGPAPLAFGYGAHYCLGAALARLEIAITLRHVLARRPALCGYPTWRDTPAIRGPLAVRTTFQIA